MKNHTLSVAALRESKIVPWPDAVYQALCDANVRQASYVPDAGHARLIELLHEDGRIRPIVLTTEEEGIAISAGAWLGGHNSVVLMQSSGVGNCINALSLPVISQMPLLILVTMRGEWCEFNPWQVPMGSATQRSLEAIGVTVRRADDPADLIDLVKSCCMEAFHANRQIAVLIGQRMLGEKKW